MQRVFFILLVLTGLAFWLQITWLYTALGLLLVALILAHALARPARPPARMMMVAPPRPAPSRQIIVVQQPAARQGMGFFDIFMGAMMASRVLFPKGISEPFKKSFSSLDTRLQGIEKKLGND